MSAIISTDGLYRYRLDRHITSITRDHAYRCVFIMLNPSTADATNDDPTIRRCIGFADEWKFADMTVVNLFAYRATSPKDMKNALDPIGPENNQHIITACREASLIVAAWGAHGSFKGRDRDVLAMLNDSQHLDVFCLEKTKQGMPKHPLYIKKTAVPFLYSAI